MKRLFVMTVLTTLVTAAQAEEAVQSTVAASTTTTASAPATVASATSGTTSGSLLEAETAAKSKWSFNALAQAEIASSEMHYSNSTDKTVDFTNAVGLGYKFNKENSIGFKQYFDVKHDGQKKTNKADLSYPVLTYGHTFQGVAKSDPVSALFWYYVPVTATDYKVQNNGLLRMDAEVNWTLSPKWSLSYYLNPRQSLIPTETTLDDNPVFAKTTLIHFGTLYYNVNDTISYYLNVGFRHDWKTASLDLVKEQYLTNLGASFSFFGGKLNLNPEIDYAVVLPRSGQSLEVASTYAEANLSYLLTTAVVF
ncbi:MAG TPA: hypothetical protein VIG33_08440 [Pseudobdellovibrionaceae bacterium]|jgi:hypothetical protein